MFNKFYFSETVPFIR